MLFFLFHHMPDFSGIGMIAQHGKLAFIDGLGGALSGMIDAQIFGQPCICPGFAWGSLFGDI